MTAAGVIVDINEDGATIFTTNKVTSDATEVESWEADTAPWATDSAIATQATLTFDIDQIGSEAAGDVLVCGGAGRFN